MSDNANGADKAGETKDSKAPEKVTEAVEKAEKKGTVEVKKSDEAKAEKEKTSTTAAGATAGTEAEKGEAKDDDASSKPGPPGTSVPGTSGEQKKDNVLHIHSGWPDIQSKMANKVLA